MSLFLFWLQTEKKMKLYSLFNVYCDKGEIIKKLNHKLHMPLKAAGIKLRSSFFINGRSPHSVLS